MTTLKVDPELNIDAIAIFEVKKYQSTNVDWKGKQLRIYLSGKNCDGFEYGVCFDTLEPGDLCKDYGDFSVICDQESYKFIKGSIVTFVDDERGRGFVVENPSHKKFRGKFFKRKSWIQNAPEKTGDAPY